MATILGANSDSGYEISNSLRFNDDDSARLLRAQSNGDQDKWTWSGWVKRSNISSTQCFFATTDGSATSFDAKFDSSDRIEVYNYFGGGFDSKLVSNRVFRDVGAWYNIQVVYDSGNSTEAHRLRIYVNGTELDSFSTTNYPSLNADSDLNVSGSNIEIGRQSNGSQFFDGYMSDVYLVDGQALAPTDFSETNENGVWVPKEYTGTYGTNGFKLEFQQTGTSANSSGLGADTSGNDNHFTPTNFAAHDVVTDTPTNNFCTLNSLDTRDTLSEGNLKRVSPQGASTSTISVGNVKWYVEFLVVTQGAILSGFVEDGYGTARNAQPHDHGDNALFYTSTGQKIIDNSFSSYGGTASAGDIVGCAFDLDNDTAQFFINNSSQGTFSKTYTAGASYFFAASDVTTATNSTDFINFGHDSSFAGAKTAQNNSDDNGHGDFYYSPPSGFLAICTKNVAETG